jgi:hypothetical protein
MPKMDGLQEMAAILQFLPTCKFIFVTSYAHHPVFREEYKRFRPESEAAVIKTLPASRSAECSRLSGVSARRSCVIDGE